MTSLDHIYHEGGKIDLDIVRIVTEARGGRRMHPEETKFMAQRFEEVLGRKTLLTDKLKAHEKLKDQKLELEAEVKVLEQDVAFYHPKGGPVNPPRSRCCRCGHKYKVHDRGIGNNPSNFCKVEGCICRNYTTPECA